MLNKLSNNELARASAVAEQEILSILLQRLSSRENLISLKELCQKTGLNTVLFELALQNLESGRFVRIDRAVGAALTNKGLLFAFDNRAQKE